MSSPFSVDAASADDVEAIMRIESDPAYRGLVGQWPRDRHLEELALASSRYFLLRETSGAVAGFALLQRLDDPDRKAHLKRIAVRETGRESGSILLEAVTSWLFTTTDINRLDLD